VTHALLVLSEDGPRPGTASLRGRVTAPPDPLFPETPVRVLLAGTGTNTVADPEPRLPGVRAFRAGYVLGDLAPGTYRVGFQRTGCRTLWKELRLRAGEDRELTVELTPDKHRHNRVRNSDFQLSWLVPGRPDHWTRTESGWRSDVFPVLPGRTYQAGARDGSGNRRLLLRTGIDPRSLPLTHGIEWSTGEARPLLGTYGQLEVLGAAQPTEVWVAPVQGEGEVERDG